MKLHTRVTLANGDVFCLPHDHYDKLVKRIRTSLAQHPIYEAENLFGDKVAFNVTQVMTVQEVSQTGLEQASEFSDEINEIFDEDSPAWE